MSVCHTSLKDLLHTYLLTFNDNISNRKQQKSMITAITQVNGEQLICRHTELKSVKRTN